MKVYSLAFESAGKREGQGCLVSPTWLAVRQDPNERPLCLILCYKAFDCTIVQNVQFR